MSYPHPSSSMYTASKHLPRHDPHCPADAVSLKERQLGEGLAAAAAVVEAAATANPAEAPLARARLAGIRGHVAA